MSVLGFVVFFLGLKWVFRKQGKDNAFRCTYVLPDGVTHTKGFVKNPEEAQRYLALGDGDTLEEVQQKMDVDQMEVTNKLEDRKKIDLTKNVIFLPYI